MPETTAEREALKVAGDEYAELLAKYDAMQDRVRAAITEVVAESGTGSPQHLRLRGALTGEGTGSPSLAAARRSRITNCGCGPEHARDCPAELGC